MNKSDRDQLTLEIDHIFDSGANPTRVKEMVERFIKSRYSYSKIAEDLKILMEKNGHTKLDSVVSLYEQKAEAYRMGRHWFTMKEGRNVCEFCGTLYHISKRGSKCMS